MLRMENIYPSGSNGIRKYIFFNILCYILCLLKFLTSGRTNSTRSLLLTVCEFRISDFSLVTAAKYDIT